MITPARPIAPDSVHWYARNGEPMHTVLSKKGMPRITTLADARKLNLLPSVTTILKILHKEALVQWKIEQACLAVLTTPRPAEESLDAFVERVLHEERVQEDEANKARELGTLMHQGLQRLLTGKEVHKELLPWIEPAAFRLRSWVNDIIGTEEVVCATSYAGTLDFSGTIDTSGGLGLVIVDYKTTRKIPKQSYMEHRLQLSAYAAAKKNTSIPIETANMYISTAERGEFALLLNPPWQPDFVEGFVPLLKVWCYLNNYTPKIT